MFSQDTVTVLVLDADVTIRTNLSEHLRVAGYRVREAASIGEAVSSLEADGAAVASILCNMAMGGSQAAFSFASRVRRTWPEAAVVLSGSLEKSVRDTARLCSLGPRGQRETDSASLLDTIRQQIARRNRCASDVARQPS